MGHIRVKRNTRTGSEILVMVVTRKLNYAVKSGILRRSGRGYLSAVDAERIYF